MIATKFPPCSTTRGTGHVVTQTMNHSLCYIDDDGRYALCYYAKPRANESEGKHYVQRHLPTGLVMGAMLQIFDTFKDK